MIRDNVQLSGLRGRSVLCFLVGVMFRSGGAAKRISCLGLLQLYCSSV
jgi:hypothetical protein